MAIQLFLNAGSQFCTSFQRQHIGESKVLLSKCVPWTRSTGITWVLMRNTNVDSHNPIQTNGISICILTASLKDMYTQ